MPAASIIVRPRHPASARLLATACALLLGLGCAGVGAGADDMVGHQLPAVPLGDGNGAFLLLDKAWDKLPALVVAVQPASPEARALCPQLRALTERFTGEARVVMIAVAQAGEGRPLPLAGADADEQAAEAQELRERLNGIPVWLDRDGILGAMIGGAPCTFTLVDAGGRVRGRWNAWQPEDIVAGTRATLTAIAAAREAHAAEQHALAARLTGAGISEANLVTACSLGDAQTISGLLDQVPDLPRYVVSEGLARPHTLLGLAVEHDRVEVASLLERRGADPDQGDDDAVPAWLLAAELGDPAMLAALATHHDRNAGSERPSAHALALMYGHAEYANALPRGANDDDDVFIAAAANDLDALRATLRLHPWRAWMADGWGRTPMCYAAANGAVAAAQLLLSYGADPGRSTLGGGELPLHFAARRGQEAMAKLLLASGAAVDARDGRLGTPLHLASRAGYGDLVADLLAAKADPNSRDGSGRTPLHVAAAEGRRDCVAILLNHGADRVAIVTAYEMPDGSLIPASRDTALHLAAGNLQVEVVRELLRLGTTHELNARNADGDTPLHLAASAPADDRKVMVLGLLADGGADLAWVDHEGNTCLDLALAAHDDAAADFLRDHGAVVLKHLPADPNNGAASASAGAPKP
jgi:ankyrin repeat protein